MQGANQGTNQNCQSKGGTQITLKTPPPSELHNDLWSLVALYLISRSVGLLCDSRFLLNKLLTNK